MDINSVSLQLSILKPLLVAKKYFISYWQWEKMIQSAISSNSVRCNKKKIVSVRALSGGDWQWNFDQPEFSHKKTKIRKLRSARWSGKCNVLWGNDSNTAWQSVCHQCLSASRCHDSAVQEGFLNGVVNKPFFADMSIFHTSECVHWCIVMAKCVICTSVHDYALYKEGERQMYKC